MKTKCYIDDNVDGQDGVVMMKTGVVRFWSRFYAPLPTCKIEVSGYMHVTCNPKNKVCTTHKECTARNSAQHTAIPQNYPVDDLQFATCKIQN